MHVLFVAILVTFLGPLGFYEVWGLLNPMGLMTMRNNNLSPLQSQYNTLTSIVSTTYSYVDHIYIVLLPSNRTEAVPSFMQKVEVFNNVTEKGDLLRVLFTGSYSLTNRQRTQNIIMDSFVDEKTLGDNMFYQVNRNRSRSGLICAGHECESEWLELFGDKTFSLKRVLREEGRAVNTLIEQMHNDEQKGVIVADFRNFNKSVQGFYEELQNVKANVVIIKDQEGKTELYTNPRYPQAIASGFNQNHHTTDHVIDLLSICPSLLSIMGTGININNNGLVSIELLKMYNQTDSNHAAQVLFGNAQQLKELFLKVKESFYFKDLVIAERYEEIVNEYSFIQDYFEEYFLGAALKAKREHTDKLAKFQQRIS